MALPLTRNTNYSPGATPVKGVDLNDFQDQIIGLNTRVTRVEGLLTLTIVVPIIAPTVSIAPLTVLNAQVSGTGSGSHILYVTLPTIRGWTIAAVRVRVQDSATGPTKLECKVLSTTDGAQSFAAVTTSSPSAGTGAEQTITAAPNVAAAAATQYWVSVETNTGSASCNVYRLELDLTPPP